MELYRDANAKVEDRVRDLLSRMTLEEKAAQTTIIRGVEYATRPSAIQHCSVDEDSDFDYDRLTADLSDAGVGCVHDTYTTPAVLNRLQHYFLTHSRLPIPVIFTGEALHGIEGTRGQIFPSPVNLGATFNPDLVCRVGQAIGREARSLGIHEILAPNLDVARELRWGRVEETFGEDTYLSSRMARAIVKGEQKGDVSRPDAVISECKHYVVHGIAEGGINCNAARVGEREIETEYLPVFASAIDEGAYNVMVAYHAIDGIPMMCHKKYLKDVLKDRLGLRGFSRADWGGVHRLYHAFHLAQDEEDAIRIAFNGGLDASGACDYPAGVWRDCIVRFVRDGKISMERLDEAVSRILRVKFELGLFEHPYTDEQAFRDIIRCPEHAALSRRAAVESAVLLWNDGTLPLNPEAFSSIAIVGPSSAAQKLGGYTCRVNGYTVRSVYDEMKLALGPDHTVRQCNGCAITQDDGARIVDGQPHLESAGEGRIEDEIELALSIASACDVIVMVGGDNTVTSGEGRDRCGLELYGRQTELIEALSKLGKPLILVLENGKPAVLTRESELCSAILMAGFGGEYGAGAIVDLLLGRENPSGRLNLSYPRDSRMLPVYYSSQMAGVAEEYLEGSRKALYPFGYGLSYTHFTYSDLHLDVRPDLSVLVSFTLCNDGPMDGAEVAQCYVSDDVASVARPFALLKGFEKVFLRSGQSRTLQMVLPPESFRILDASGRFVIEEGTFTVRVGSSSRDFALQGQIRLPSMIL